MTPRMQAAMARSATGHKLLMAALVAGDPHPDATLDAMSALATHGVDLIELILPSSDPTFHGPVIQRAMARALRERITMADVMELIARFRAQHATPICLSSYTNRLLAHGFEAVASQLAASGGDGLMITDRTFEGAAEVQAALAPYDLSFAPAIAAETPPARAAMIRDAAPAFCIWAGHIGNELGDRARALDALQALAPGRAPVLASAQISEPAQAAQVAQRAQGVLIGSAFIWIVEGRGPELLDRLGSFAQRVRQSLDEVADL